MKKYFLIIFILIGLIAWVGIDSDTLNTGNNTVYKIKEGDCLWNIAKKFYNNPYLWPKIWERNPYIKNPDLIFPEDELVIPNLNGEKNPVETKMVQQSNNQTTVPVETEEEVEEQNIPVKSEETVTAKTNNNKASSNPTKEQVAPQEENNNVPMNNNEEENVSEQENTESAPPSVSNYSDKDIVINYDEYVLRAGGVVDENELDNVGYISGFESEYNSLHASNEIAYVNLNIDEVAVGDLFIIYSLGEKVKDPATKQILGRKLKVKGILKIVEMGENAVKGTIKSAFDVINKGDFLMPYNEKDWLFNPSKGTPQEKDGYIVSYSGVGKLIGKVQDFVYIDLGKDAGVKQGMEFYIVKPPKKVNGSYTDPEKIGLLKVVKVFEYSSSCIIENISDEIEVGTEVEYKE